MLEKDRLNWVQNREFFGKVLPFVIIEIIYRKQKERFFYSILELGKPAIIQNVNIEKWKSEEFSTCKEFAVVK